MDNRTKTMQALVKKEAANLKKNATKEELAKLDFDRLDGDSPYSCMYGQMTGHCYSNRASELIFNCCERVYIPLSKSAPPLLVVQS